MWRPFLCQENSCKNFAKWFLLADTMQRCVQILFKLRSIPKVGKSVEKEHDAITPNPSGRSLEVYLTGKFRV